MKLGVRIKEEFSEEKEFAQIKILWLLIEEGREDAASPSLNWGQWLGETGADRIYALAVNADELYAGGYSASSASWESVTFQGGYSGGGAEGFVLEIADGASPSLNWGQWLGGSGADIVYALAVNADEIYAGGYAFSAASWESVTFQGSYSGSNEGFVVEIADAVQGNTIFFGNHF